MLFKLKNVSVIFNDILREYLNNFIIIYFNNILIYLNNLKMHYKHVHKILAKLNERVLYIKKLKSRFKIKKIEFLKYVIQFK